MENNSGRVDVLNAGVGGGLGIGPAGAKAKVEAGVDLVKSTAKFGGGKELSANIGLNASTGFETGAGAVNASVGGFGGSIWENHRNKHSIWGRKLQALVMKVSFQLLAVLQLIFFLSFFYL